MFQGTSLFGPTTAFAVKKSFAGRPTRHTVGKLGMFCTQVQCAAVIRAQLQDRAGRDSIPAFRGEEVGGGGGVSV